MVGEYKVRSGFKCNPWAIKKLCGLQHPAFICPCHGDPSAATISPSHCWLLIQMYSPCLPPPGVGAPSDTVLHVYSLVVMSLNKSSCLPSGPFLLAASNSYAFKAAAVRWGPWLFQMNGKQSRHLALCFFSCARGIVMSAGWWYDNFVSQHIWTSSTHPSSFNALMSFLHCERAP